MSDKTAKSGNWLVVVFVGFWTAITLLFDGIDNREYVIQFVTRGDYQDRDGRLARFVDIYQHSPVVRAELDKAHGTLYQPGWE